MLNWRHTLAAATLGLALLGPSSAFAQAPTPPPSDVTTDQSPATGVPSDTGEVVQSWALSPAASSTNPDQSGGRTTFSYTVDPGEKVDDSLTVFNYSNVPMTFRIYATDAFNNDAGAFDILTSDKKPTDVGSWVSIEQEFLTLQPNTQATLPFTLTVPADAAPGDHAGAIVASNTAEGQEVNGAIVDVERRTGSRIYLRVNGPVEANLAVASVSTTYRQSVNPFGGEAEVAYTIENRGNVRLGGTAELQLEGPFGLGGKTVELPEVQELLPGQKFTGTVLVDDVPALFLLRSSVSITPSSPDGVADLTSTTGSTSSFTPPLALLGVLLALLVALLAIRSIQRRRRAARPATTEPGHDPAEAVREPQHT
jgi:hypothetical protein